MLAGWICINRKPTHEFLIPLNSNVSAICHRLAVIYRGGGRKSVTTNLSTSCGVIERLDHHCSDDLVVLVVKAENIERKERL